MDIALASEPDVIICDAMLPAFFGCETLQPLIEYSFVLLSDVREDIQHWIDHGNCCVVHPMDLDSDLVPAVRAAAAGKILHLAPGIRGDRRHAGCELRTDTPLARRAVGRSAGWLRLPPF